MISLTSTNIIVAIISIMVGYLLIRLTVCLPSFSGNHRIKLAKGKKISTMIVWGSGGHTTEMIFLLEQFPVDSFGPIYHVISQSDHTSRKKIEKSKIAVGLIGTWSEITRSREVKQSWISTIATTAFSLIQCTLLVLSMRPQLIICNGPGTCVPLAISAFIFRVLGIVDTRIFFVESFCRVDSLSLTGKLLYFIADRFVVQWPQLLTKYKRAEYLGDGEKIGQQNKKDD